MAPLGTTRMRVEFRIPSRGLFGYRSEFLTDTHGEGILNTIFDGYDEWRGELPARSTGSLISYETGVAVAYGLFNAQQRGTLIVEPGRQGLRGHGRWVQPCRRGHHRQRMQNKAPLQYPRLRQRTTRCAWCLCPNSVWKKVWSF